MRISIAARLRPFSHIPGVSCLIPKSSCELQAFPTLLRFNGASDLKLKLKGPMRDFTVEQDLEEGLVRIFGHAREGYVRYTLSQEGQGIAIYFERAPEAGIHCEFSSKRFVLHAKERHLIPLTTITCGEHSQERLSLGMHRSQDWELVHRRQALGEIFPAWLRLANLTPQTGGTTPLLRSCAEQIAEENREALVPEFLNLFNAHFKGILMPRLVDDQHQGLAPEASELPANLSPLTLISEGARLIRSLFVQERKEGVAFVPCLPPEFHAGRFIRISCANGDEIDMEWSKKLLSKLIWRSGSSHQAQPIFQKPIKGFRLRSSLKDKGVSIKANTPFFLEAGGTYYLDRFHK